MTVVLVLTLLINVLLSYFAAGLVTIETAETCSVAPCGGPAEVIFCRGPILAARWNYSSHVNFEGKELSQAPNKIVQEYDTLEDNTTAVEIFVQSQVFLNKTGVQDAIPEDWVESPASLDLILNATFRDFARYLNKKWLNLTKKTPQDVFDRSERYSVKWVPNAFIVPGGRFSNYFYWDSYFVVKGLIFSGMLETTKGILGNFVSLVSEKGFVPNCGLRPCARRSQPPLMSWMFDMYYNATGDRSFLEENVEFLRKELTFWENNRSVVIDGKKYFHYNATATCPRPEEYLNDIETANNSTFEPSEVFRNLASGAESGLDFSSKWLTWEGTDALTLSGIITNHIVPVELNAIMCRNYKLLANFYAVLGKTDISQLYEDKWIQMQTAIESLLWNATDGIWYDYNKVRKLHRNRFYPTNVMPLFDCVTNVTAKVKSIADYWEKSAVMSYPGGVPASLTDTGQQWDFPNLWAPLTDFVVDSFVSTGDSTLRNYAMDLVGKFLEITLNGYMNYGDVYEKYNVTAPDGHPGGGGEYVVQRGFGWTNGVILDFLKKYSNDLRVVVAEDEMDAKTPPPASSVLTAVTLPKMSVRQLDKIEEEMAEKQETQSTGLSVVIVAATAAIALGLGFAVVYFYKSRTSRQQVPEYQLLLGGDETL